MVIVFLAGLAGLAWVVSASGGYHFGFTLLVVVGAYVALLLAYVCYRWAAQKVRVARVKTRTGRDPDPTQHLSSYGENSNTPSTDQQTNNRDRYKVAEP